MNRNIFSLLSVTFISFVFLCLRASAVKRFGIKTSNHQYAGNTYGVSLILSYNKALYQCVINPTNSATEYVCDGDDSLISYGCQDKQEIFIQNNDNRQNIDGVIIADIVIIDSSGKKNYILTNELCLDEYDCGSNTALVTISGGTMSAIADKTNDQYVANCAYNTLSSFGIKTSNHQYAGNSYGARLILSYNKAIYECVIYPTNVATEYLCDGVQSLIGYDCQDKQEIFIQNNDNRQNIDGLIIADIVIIDSSTKRNYILTNELCLDEYDCGSNTALVTISSGTMSAIADISKDKYIPNCVYGLDNYFADRFAPYLRFDSKATDGLNGFPTIYNFPNGRASTQNMNSDISKIPTYYLIYRDSLNNKITSIGYFWFYSYQTACAYDGITVLNSIPGDFENILTNTLKTLSLGAIDKEDIGEHDNDVEKIFINLNNDYTIKSVTYHQHNGKYTVLPNNGLQIYSSTHPYVYIGRTSHGSYHNMLSNVGGCGYFHDYRDGAIQRKSWLNLQEASFRFGDERENNWDSDTFCSPPGCDWDKCKTSDDIKKNNVEFCTPLQCKNYKTSCLIPWSISEIVIAAANIKDKYFILNHTGDPDCSCVSTLFGNVCAGEHVEGFVCTPKFAETPSIIPIHDVLPIDNKYHENNDNILITISIWYLLIIGFFIILLLVNCSMMIYIKCIKKRNKYESIKFDSESDEEFE